ncbi:hypothetical protein SUGI_0192170 [Cryptomeria japonica]|uniref:uncharacterized protein LOC131055737 n=1 Tax=Cryptomeria japonica TaxID=3369 RepID=UPI002408B99C|nr:uncharacterized protein LOC131055737 [Cryptomeria japonica]GLJ12498.1 hypothetical protein SUGI_0192170 [Cryptomeria japonica]
MAAISLPLLLFSSSYFNSDPIGEEEFEECNTLTVLDYGNTGKPSRWMTPQYLNLQIRCSGLMRDEAHRALKHHFRGERNESLQNSSGVRNKIKWPHENENEDGNFVENCFGESLLPTFLAVEVDDCKLGSEVLQESLTDLSNGNRTVGDAEQSNQL